MSAKINDSDREARLAAIRQRLETLGLDEDMVEGARRWARGMDGAKDASATTEPKRRF